MTIFSIPKTLVTTALSAIKEISTEMKTSVRSASLDMVPAHLEQDHAISANQDYCFECVNVYTHYTEYSDSLGPDENGDCESCQDTNCKVCSSNYSVCEECKDKFGFNESDKCVNCEDK